MTCAVAPVTPLTLSSAVKASLFVDNVMALFGAIRAWELLGRELGTHWADFGNVEPNPNRTMPWSAVEWIADADLTRAQW